MLHNAPRRSVKVHCYTCHEIRHWDDEEALVRQQFNRFMRLHELMRGCNVDVLRDVLYREEDAHE